MPITLYMAADRQTYDAENDIPEMRTLKSAHHLSASHMDLIGLYISTEFKMCPQDVLGLLDMQ